MKKYRVNFDVFDLEERPIGIELILNGSQVELLRYLERQNVIDGFECTLLEDITDLSEE